MTLIPATFTFISGPTNAPNVETGSSMINEPDRAQPIILQVLLTLVFCIALIQILFYLVILCIQVYGHLKEQNKKYFKVSAKVLLIPIFALILSRLVLVCWSLDFLPRYVIHFASDDLILIKT